MDRDKLLISVFIALTVWTISLGIRQWALLNESLVELYYSRSFFPIVSYYISHFSEQFKFSLGEWLFIIALIAFAFFCVRLCLKRRFIKLLTSILLITGIIYMVFLFSWGLNYYRAPLSDTMKLKRGDVTAAELTELCKALTIKANQLADNQIIALEGSVSGDTLDFINKAADGYAALSEKWDFLETNGNTVKPIYNSKLLSWMGISGVYLFYTAEPNINIDQPFFMRASSACHELAHRIGFAREDEANFLAWLACSNNTSLEYQYSGALLALINISNALAASDWDAFSEIRDSYSPKLRADLTALNEYWADFDGPWDKIVDRLNDLYLKGNNQPSGTRSYGEMIYLLLDYTRQYGID